MIHLDRRSDLRCNLPVMGSCEAPSPCPTHSGTVPQTRMTTPVLKGVEPLFFTPLVSFQIPDSEALNRRLLEEIGMRRGTSEGVHVSNQGGWHSEPDLFERPEPGFRALCTHILAALGSATAAIAPGFDMRSAAVHCEGWVNVNGPGAYNTPHDHPGWAWSGTYYVRVPADTTGRSGSFELIDSRTNVRVVTVEGANCFAGKYTVRPQAGLMIIFPSYVRHWVYPNESRDERVSIAFNARFARRNR
ncbi:MAG: hypothetical protein GC151_10700 [Betaproteobacteria bacterium]|nr:hypothetical protein [Betaproteobacteria bacterium]